MLGLQVRPLPLRPIGTCLSNSATQTGTGLLASGGTAVLFGSRRFARPRSEPGKEVIWGIPVEQRIPSEMFVE